VSSRVAEIVTESNSEFAAPGGAAATELPLVLLSHRGPITFDWDESGRTASRGSGGLVTALMGLAEHLADAVWVCAASSDEDRVVVGEAGGRSVLVATGAEPAIVAGDDSVEGSTLRIKMVAVEPAAHDAFYAVISNPLLWFVQHSLYGLAESPVITQVEHAAFDDGYVAVNRLFADAVADEVEARGGKALVMLHDYHFYLVAEQVRRRCPHALLSHFVHIPWPGPDTWLTLPPTMRDPLLRGLLGNDVVGFQTLGFARNFVRCCQDLLDLPADLDALTVSVDGRTVQVRHYPISVDPAALDRIAAAPATQEYAADLAGAFQSDGRQLILRVDRTDPSKNVVRGFLAFGTLLDNHPELVGKVSFLALLQPSRTDVPEYFDYIAHIGAVVAEVNARHTNEGRQPIDMRMVEDYALVVAAYSVCDVVMVNPVADGMNLVAKEFLLVNSRDGVLALSETAGAYEELREHVLALHPFDVAQMAEALYEALTMDADQRREQRVAAAAHVRTHDVRAWLTAQLEDLAAVQRLGRREAPAAPAAPLPPREAAKHQRRTAARPRG